MTGFELALLVIGILCVPLLSVSIFLILKKSNKTEDTSIKKSISEGMVHSAELITNNVITANKLNTDGTDKRLDEIKNEMTKLNEGNNKNFLNITEKLNSSLNEMTRSLREENEKSIQNLKTSFDELSKNMGERYALIEKSITDSLATIRQENADKLQAIQQAVDDKLQKTLDERLKTSFQSVVEQIGNVNVAIGEIKSIAGGVNSLKNALTNVKVKGNIGEVILANIIEEVLAPNQYAKNVSTKKGTSSVVEFAIKMPSQIEGENVLLPVDAKFPLEPYTKLKEAIDEGDKIQIENARKELRQRIINSAKDINSKYIDTPNTTNFAVMFLPTEGLYLEVIESGLYEEIQRKYSITAIGPSTIYAFLNSLRSGFNLVAIQKRSTEVFQLLEAVKTEFNNFANALDDAKKKVDTAGKSLHALVTTRTNVMQRAMKDITVLDDGSEKAILGIEEFTDVTE
ncbi:MAG: DNA recombination protein RmuC [Clostridia bacterium]|nr:DNA recombination protein RmuC [Clostridia bacterium]